MSWSIDGADKMARLRAFKANKDKVYDFLRAKRKKRNFMKLLKVL